MIILRLVLFSIIIYLIIRSFVRYGEKDTLSSQKTEPDKNSKIVSKRVSKEIGEYVDYEEVDMLKKE